MFSLVFDRPLAADVLSAAPELLRDHFASPDRQETVELGVSLGPGGHQLAMEPKRQFAGWVFKDVAQSPTRVINIGLSGLMIHAVRPGQWPQGEYAGWDTIYEDALFVFETVGHMYAGLTLERAGLRYLNRIAVPRESQFDDWFTIGFRAPSFLQEEYALNLRETWGTVDGDEEFSASVGLATIQIPEPSLAETHVGYLLDIEIFNLWKPFAPTLGRVRDWFERAHEVEGDIFESSITDQLRERFEII